MKTLTPYELAVRYIQGRGHWTNDPQFIEQYLIAEINLTESKDGLELSPDYWDRINVALRTLEKNFRQMGNVAFGISEKMSKIKVFERE